MSLSSFTRCLPHGVFREAATMAPTRLQIHPRVMSVNPTSAAAECTLLREGIGNRQDLHAYDRACIDLAAREGVFEGSQCYFDHPPENTFDDRSVEKLAGWWSDVRAQTGKDGLRELVGTLHVDKENRKALSLLREAVAFNKHYGDNPAKAFLGISIFASGASERATVDGREVNRVTRIIDGGADIVSQAGAGGAVRSLREGQRSVYARKSGEPNWARLERVVTALRGGKAPIRESGGLLDVSGIY